MSTHEQFDREEAVKGSSNRTLGFVFAAFFALVAFVPLVRGHSIRWWAVVPGGLFLIVALFAPVLLGPLNRVWTGFGVLLHKVTSPIILGVLFYLVFTPFGWILRLAGKDFLRLKRAPAEESYWLPRCPPGPPPESMSNQF